MLIFNHNNYLYYGNKNIPIINESETNSGIKYARTKFPENRSFKYPDLSNPIIKEAYCQLTGNGIYKVSMAGEAGTRHRVEILIEDDDGNLLTGINPRTSKVVFPGGGIEDGEDIFEAAKREAKEEVGYNIEPLEVVNKENPLPWIRNDGSVSSLTTFVRARIKPGTKKKYGYNDGDRLQDVKFSDIDYVYDNIDPNKHSILPPKKKPSQEEKVAHIHLFIDKEPMYDISVSFLANTLNTNYIVKKAGKGITATVGQILFNNMLPDTLRKYDRIVDKKEMQKVLRKVAEKYPNKYKDISFNMYKIGDHAAVFDTKHLRYSDLKPIVDIKPYLREADREYTRLKAKMPDDMAYADAYNTMKDKLTKDSLEAGVKNKNHLAIMAISGAKGSSKQFTDITTGPIQVSDYKNRPVHVVLDKGYASGITPAQYFASSYGTRRGMISVKLMVPLAGYMSKMLGWTMGGEVVTEKDCGTINGVPQQAEDKWNLGKFLAKDEGKYKAGTEITSDIVEDLKGKRIIVRSPMTCQAEQGVCSKCLGKSEVGMAPIGYNAGLNASSAMAEPAQQGMLSEKHTGGAVKKRVGGYPLIKRLIEIPDTFENEAILSTKHGNITKIDKMDWGGWKIYVGDTDHYTPESNPPIVKIGDKIEKGDELTEGIANPAKKTELTGFGSARKYLAKTLQDTYEEAGMGGLDRVHYEIAAKSLINFADVQDKIGKYLPGDTIKLDAIKKNIEFDKVDEVQTKDAEVYNTYLAKNYMHYTVGTELTNKVKDDLISGGYTKIMITKEKPKFTPLMVRVQDTASKDSDWVTRLSSQGLKSSIIKAVQRGDESSTTGVNFIHPYIHGQNFGRNNLY